MFRSCTTSRLVPGTLAAASTTPGPASLAFARNYANAGKLATSSSVGGGLTRRLQSVSLAMWTAQLKQQQQHHPLLGARRTQFGHEPPVSKTLCRVARRANEEEVFVQNSEGTGSLGDSRSNAYAEYGVDTTAEDTATAAAEKLNSKESEDDSNKMVEFTDEEAQRLDRLFGKTVQQKTFLSEKEREQLEKMLFMEFYADLGQSKDDPAMRYQAALELTWLEEWVEGLMRSSGKKGRITPTSSVIPPRTDDEARRLIKKSVLERVDLHKPLSYIIGSQPFYGCDILCRPPLLCPRPETEMWTHWYVHECLSRATPIEAPLRIVDMCCGTGCIGVAVAKHVPRAAVTAVDLLPEAVATSNENARLNGIPSTRYEAVVSDMLDYFTEGSTVAQGHAGQAQTNAYPAMPERKAEERSEPHSANKVHDMKASQEKEKEKEETGNVKESDESLPRFYSPVNPPTRPRSQVAPQHLGAYDVLVANPPYVLPDQYVSLPRSITHWESKMALVGDDYRETRQYLYFQELCECGVRLLKKRIDRDPVLRHQPNFVLEVGLQARMVATLMERSGLFEDVEVHLDYAQQERWITANTRH